MPNYKAIYFRLLAAQADAVDQLEKTADTLRQAHCQTEGQAMDAREPLALASGKAGGARKKHKPAGGAAHCPPRGKR